MNAVQKVSATINPHELPSVKLKSLWTMDVMTDASRDRFTAPEIADYLVETCHINTSRQAVTSALAKENSLVNKDKRGYKLMQSGRDTLANSLTSRVHVIESGKPFLAKYVILKEIFDGLVGEVELVDPYLDISTLDLLFNNLDKKIPVRIMTQSISSKPHGAFERHLADLHKDGYRIEVRKYAKSELHDRYIIDDRVIWHSGNSLKSLGTKESFLMLLNDDTREIMRAKFNERWQISSIL